MGLLKIYPAYITLHVKMRISLDTYIVFVKYRDIRHSARNNKFIYVYILLFIDCTNAIRIFYVMRAVIYLTLYNPVIVIDSSYY